MKAVTEFASFILNKGLTAKAALVAEGKTPEEIQASLGESFKYEGEKLTYFVNSLEVAGANTESLKRVVVMRPNEGEAAPPKATKVEELFYVPEFIVLTTERSSAKVDPKGGKRGGRGDKPKGSPWGLSPEEIAEKNSRKTGGKPSTK